MKNAIKNLGIFLGMFGAYLFTCAPHVPPYRDSGEMASDLLILGVAHAPGYPLYVLLGKLFSVCSVGNWVFRANVFSALAGALAVFVIFRILKRWMTDFPAFIGAAIFGFSIRFWELACVPEMYTLGVFWVSLVLASFFIRESPYLTFFLFGLGLGVRMDTLLLLPLFIILFGKTIPPKKWLGNLFFILLGISIFIFLPVRSIQGPLINWSKPDSLGALFNILTRKSYGGTLDLLSLSYGRGENFLINLQLYFSQFIESFGWWGLILVCFGIFSAWKNYRKVAIFLLASFVISGPLFLFLANMPPNPHAVAIIQASYLVPDLFLSLFIGFGLQFLINLPRSKWIFSTAAIFIIASNISANYPKVTKRTNFFIRDYVGNVLKSCPPKAVAVFHKDVQLFSLWEAQLIEKRRKDVGLVATGLSGSPWYWEMMGKWGTDRAPQVSLREFGGWTILKNQCQRRPLVFGFETDFPETPELKSIPSGLVAEAVWSKNPARTKFPNILNDLCLFRGRYKYGETPDFFSTDLIGDTARATYKQGFQFFLDRDWEKADWFMRRAEFLDPTFAKPVSDRAYMLFVSGRKKEANVLHKLAVLKNEKTLHMAEKYRSLPDVVLGVKRDLSEAYVNYGASSENLGNKAEARDAYEKAIELTASPQAYFNLAVTFWGEDWDRVVANLETVRRLDAKFPGVDKFLFEAKKHLKPKYL